MIRNRLVELRKVLGLKQTGFAQKLGITNAAVSAIELGKAPLTETNIRLICLTFGVNEVWFRDGIGEMFTNEGQLSDWERRLLELFQELTPKARKMLVEYAEKLVSDERTLRNDADFEKDAQTG